MPRRSRTALSLEEQALREHNADLDAAIALIASEEGPAPGARQASDDDEVRMWGTRDNMVDHDAMVQRLMTTGYPPEMLDPEGENTLEIVKQHPDLAQFYGQPTQDHALAEILATYAEYPFRLGLLSDLEDDPEQQVKKAERLNSRWQKEIGESAPMMQPAAVPPVMPTPEQPMSQIPNDVMGMVGG